MKKILIFLFFVFISFTNLYAQNNSSSNTQNNSDLPPKVEIQNNELPLENLICGKGDYKYFGFRSCNDFIPDLENKVLKPIMSDILARYHESGEIVRFDMNAPLNFCIAGSNKVPKVVSGAKCVLPWGKSNVNNQCPWQTCNVEEYKPETCQYERAVLRGLYTWIYLHYYEEVLNEIKIDKKLKIKEEPFCKNYYEAIKKLYYGSDENIGIFKAREIFNQKFNFTENIFKNSKNTVEACLENKLSGTTEEEKDKKLKSNYFESTNAFCSLVEAQEKILDLFRKLAFCEISNRAMIDIVEIVFGNGNNSYFRRFINSHADMCGSYVKSKVYCGTDSDGNIVCTKSDYKNAANSCYKWGANWWGNHVGSLDVDLMKFYNELNVSSIILDQFKGKLNKLNDVSYPVCSSEY